MAAVRRSSARSLYRRFFGLKRHFSEQEIAFFLNVDFVSHVALVAVIDEGGRPVIIGGGRYIVEQPGKAVLLSRWSTSTRPGYRRGADASPGRDRP